MAQLTRFPAIAPALLLGLCSCGPANQYDGLFQAQQANKTPAFARGYFPEEYGKAQVYCSYLGGSLPVISEVERDWYPRQWEAAREPSFYRLSKEGVPPEFAFRFSYIPTFTPSIYVRIHKVGDRYRMIAKMMSGAGGYDPGEISQSKEIRLTPNQAFEFERRLANGKFFDQGAAPCDGGFDGSEWIFESVDKNGYKFLKRWTPQSGAVQELGVYLVGLSGFGVNIE